jgi:hypothetical protein
VKPVSTVWERAGWLFRPYLRLVKRVFLIFKFFFLTLSSHGAQPTGEMPKGKRAEHLKNVFSLKIYF